MAKVRFMNQCHNYYVCSTCDNGPDGLPEPVHQQGGGD